MWAVYGVVALTLTGVLTAILTGALPTFFTADGPTILRQVVLGLAIELFAFATLYWWLTFRSTRLAMLRWYYLVMAIFTVGLVGVFAEETVGDLISWTGRAGQFLAAPYFLIAVLLSGPTGRGRFHRTDRRRHRPRHPSRGVTQWPRDPIFGGRLTAHDS